MVSQVCCLLLKTWQTIWTRFLHDLFTWHDTGQSLLEEGIFWFTALEGVSKKPPFLRGRGQNVSLCCRLSQSTSKVRSKACNHHGNLKIWPCLFHVAVEKVGREIWNCKSAEHCSGLQTLLKNQWIQSVFQDKKSGLGFCFKQLDRRWDRSTTFGPRSLSARIASQTNPLRG